jgi:hypothetical protein
MRHLREIKTASFIITFEVNKESKPIEARISSRDGTDSEGWDAVTLYRENIEEFIDLLESSLLSFFDFDLIKYMEEKKILSG